MQNNKKLESDIPGNKMGSSLDKGVHLQKAKVRRGRWKSKHNVFRLYWSKLFNYQQWLQALVRGWWVLTNEGMKCGRVDITYVCYLCSPSRGLDSTLRLLSLLTIATSLWRGHQTDWQSSKKNNLNLNKQKSLNAAN